MSEWGLHTAAEEDFPGYSFHLVNVPYMGTRAAAAYPAGKFAPGEVVRPRDPGGESWHSAMDWDHDNVIGNIETKPQHRRKGLATALHRWVKDNHVPDLIHSPARKPDGQAWAASTGDDLDADLAEYKRRRDHTASTDLWGLHTAADDEVHQLPTSEAAQYRISLPSGDSYGGDEGFDWGWLRNDISRNGVQNPVTVYTDGSRAHLDDGNHRATLAHELGVPHVPAHVVQLSPEDYDGYADDHQGLPGGSRLVGPSLRAILSPHTASTDGVRYAHLVEADVAEDLTKLAADGWQPPQRVDLNLDPDEVLKYADPGNITEPDKLEALRPQIQRSGITTPIILTTDGSRAELNDGHHRAEIARQMGISVPVQVWPESSAYFNETHSKTGGGLSRWLQTGGRPAYEQRTKTAMPIYYHVAPADSVGSIRQHGLDHAKGKSPWGGTDGNFFWENHDDASDYANSMTDDARLDDEHHPGYAVLPFDYDGPKKKDPEAQWDDRGGSFCTTHPIPSSAFRTAMPMPLPKGTYFRYHPELVWSPGVTAHAPGGKMVGSLEWYDDDHVMVDLGTRRPGEIDRIQVPEDHRGQSIATSMFDFAKQHEPRLHHSDQLTPDGEGWSAYEQSRHARLAGRNGEPPPMTFEPFNTMWTNGIMARHAEDGRPIAHLHWYPDGEIETIRVHPELQGRDIGKAILTHAATHPETYEAEDGIQPSNNLTPAGRAFARSLGHNPSDDEVVPAEGEDQWAWKAVQKYTPMRVPYTGQNEDEMSSYLEQPWTPPNKTASTAGDGWPVWWRGKHRPGVPFDKRWGPNHPEHTQGPWES